jgi:hypothetical protein
LRGSYAGRPGYGCRRCRLPGERSGEIRGKFRVFYEGGESYFKGVRLLSRFSLNRFCRFLVNLVFIGQRHKLCFRQPNSFNY